MLTIACCAVHIGSLNCSARALLLVLRRPLRQRHQSNSVAAPRETPTPTAPPTLSAPAGTGEPAFCRLV